MQFLYFYFEYYSYVDSTSIWEAVHLLKCGLYWGLFVNICFINNSFSVNALILDEGNFEDTGKRQE